MLRKLHALVRDEMGDDRAPFDLDLFGTREVTYHKVENMRKRQPHLVGASK